MGAVYNLPRLCIPSRKRFTKSPMPTISPSSSSSSSEPNISPPEPTRKRTTPESTSPHPNPNALPPSTPPQKPPSTIDPLEAAFGKDLIDDLPPLNISPINYYNDHQVSDDLYKDWSTSSWINQYSDSIAALADAANPVDDDDDDGPFIIRTNLRSFRRRPKTFEICSSSSSMNSPPLDDFDNNLESFLSSPSSKLVGAGISNMGNTCFMSAILQCFTHTVQLFLGLRYCTHNSSACDVEGFCVICAFRDHFEASLEPSRNAVDPTMLVENLNKFSSSFTRYNQEDAHEFMQCALNKLQRCFPNGEDNLIDQIFGGRLVSKLRCCSCGHTSDKFEPMIDLSLEIENVSTIQHALESFTMVEKIDGKFTCSNCNQEVSMEKQLMLDKAPSVAAFHLKRFKKDGDTVKKVDSHVSFTLELDLQPYTSSGNGNDNEPLKYDLYAVVEHRGYSPNSGHYFCFIRSAPEKWHLMDDHKVSSVFEDVVLKHEAYILFYAKQGTPWFSSIVENEETLPKPESLDLVSNIGEFVKEQKGNDDSTEAYDKFTTDIDEECDSVMQDISSRSIGS